MFFGHLQHNTQLQYVKSKVTEVHWSGLADGMLLLAERSEVSTQTTLKEIFQYDFKRNMTRKGHFMWLYDVTNIIYLVKCFTHTHCALRLHMVHDHHL